MTKEPLTIDIQGHRGCRGLMPENSIPAFLLALEMGVNTLEMDVVISKDRQVVVSHEAFFSHEISLDPQGKEISHEEEKLHNLFRLTLEEIQAYDCGSKIHPRFPSQIKTKVYKPSLREVFERVEPLVADFNLTDLRYNIEIKRSPEEDNLFHPDVEEFVKLVLKEIHDQEISHRVILQSFDAETLQLVRKMDPTIDVAWLIDNKYGLEKNLDLLGFTPEIYSPNFNLVDAQLVEAVHEKQIKLIPWTVNKEEDLMRMISLKVDGIISDYPDRVKSLLGNKS